MIIGWLLGYPCIYHLLTSRESGDDVCINCLSMQPLIKYSIHGQYNIENNNHFIDILEFTVPKLILDNDPRLMARLSAVMNERIDIIKSNNISEANNWTNPVLYDIILKNEEFTLSSIIL